MNKKTVAIAAAICANVYVLLYQSHKLNATIEVVNVNSDLTSKLIDETTQILADVAFEGIVNNLDD